VSACQSRSQPMDEDGEMEEKRRDEPIPLSGGQDRDRMRSVGDNVVSPRLLAGSDLLSLGSDLDHRVAEAVDLRERFGLRRFNEHARGYRPRTCRWVNSKVLQDKRTDARSVQVSKRGWSNVWHKERTWSLFAKSMTLSPVVGSNSARSSRSSWATRPLGLVYRSL
jgi:hypothetical protein